MGQLTILDGGLLASVQDLGRPGHAALGVPRGGAADTLSLVVANRVLRNPDGAAAIEWTLTGGAVRADTDLLVCLTGAPMAAEVLTPVGRREPAAHAAPLSLSAGSTLRLGPATWGVRTYLAVSGGIDAEPVLGSRSRLLGARLDGCVGRALAAGDTLPTGRPSSQPPRALPAPLSAQVADDLRRSELRATPGDHPHPAFWETTFVVSDRSDRRGVRLQGPCGLPVDSGTLTTRGLPPGAVELPGADEPILLLADAPPTGGYALVACVASVDLPRAGQLRPRERIRFRPTTLDEARAAHAARRRWLDAQVPPA